VYTLTNPLIIFVCGLLSAVAIASAQGNAPPPESNSVAKVTFVARDRGGNAIQDINPEDVTVIDNGVVSKVTGIERADKLRLRVGILLITNSSTFKAQQEAAIQLLATLQPGLDQAFVLTQATPSNMRPWPAQQLVWNSDPQALTSFVRSLHWDNSVSMGARIPQKMLASTQDKLFRTILVEFRDPAREYMIDWNPLVYKQLEAHQVKEIADYQRLNIPVYAFALEDPFNVPATIPIAIPGRSETMSGENVSNSAYKASQSIIERLAAMTGGRFFSGNGNFKSGISDIENDLKNQFIVSFLAQPNGQEQRAHTLEIRVNRKDVQVVSQKQFYPKEATTH